MNLIEVPPLERSFDREAQVVFHTLRDHRLLRLESLAELAARHPAGLVEHNVGAVPIMAPGGEVPRLQDEPQRIVAGIEENGAWLVLKNIERDPEYRDLMDSLLDAAEAALPRGESTDLGREAFVFVSAPGAVTPAHVDPEQNFLLQIQGTKSMHIGRFTDEAQRARQLEAFYGGAHRNLEEVPEEIRRVDLRPGDGVYVPPDTPHWVRNGPAVSISLSITWRTRETGRRSAVWAHNHRMRHWGMEPRPVGSSRMRDTSKVVAHRALRIGDRLRATHHAA